MPSSLHTVSADNGWLLLQDTYKNSYLLSPDATFNDLDRLIRQSLKIDGHLAEFDVPHKKRNPDLFHDPLDDFGAGAYQGPGDLSGSGWLAPRTEEVVLMSVGLRQFDPEQAGQKAIFTKSESAVSFQASEPKVGPGGTTFDNVYPALTMCGYQMGKGSHPYCYGLPFNGGGELGKVIERGSTLAESFHELAETAANFFRKYGFETPQAPHENAEQYHFDSLHPKIAKWLSSKRMNRWILVGENPFFQAYKGPFEKKKLVWATPAGEQFESHAAAFASFEDSL